MSIVIASVVEGHGEVTALPKLLWRLTDRLGVVSRLSIPEPRRVPKDQLLRSGGVELAITKAAPLVTGPGGVLVLIDADAQCPAELGPPLQARAQAARPDKRIGVVLAKCEFEAWFLAAGPSLDGWQGLPPLERPADPEAGRGAKARIESWMRPIQAYNPRRDQAALTAVFDLDQAREHSPSFDKLWREVAHLLEVSP